MLRKTYKQQVIPLADQGKSSSEIAETLGCSVSTVRDIRRMIGAPANRGNR